MLETELLGYLTPTAGKKCIEVCQVLAAFVMSKTGSIVLTRLLVDFWNKEYGYSPLRREHIHDICMDVYNNWRYYQSDSKEKCLCFACRETGTECDSTVCPFDTPILKACCLSCQHHIMCRIARKSSEV